MQELRFVLVEKAASYAPFRLLSAEDVNIVWRIVFLEQIIELLQASVFLGVSGSEYLACHVVSYAQDLQRPRFDILLRLGHRGHSFDVQDLSGPLSLVMIISICLGEVEALRTFELPLLLGPRKQGRAADPTSTPVLAVFIHSPSNCCKLLVCGRRRCGPWLFHFDNLFFRFGNWLCGFLNDCRLNVHCFTNIVFIICVFDLLLGRYED